MPHLDYKQGYSSQSDKEENFDIKSQHKFSRPIPETMLQSAITYVINRRTYSSNMVDLQRQQGLKVLLN